MTERNYRESAAAVLAGRLTVHDFNEHERKRLVRWATRHRLAGLLWQVDGAGNAGDGHDGLDELFGAACRQTAYSAYQEVELRRVVGELASAGISPVFLKGAALAYTVYPDAALRPRADHDLLVRPDEADGVRAVFERLGYETELQPPGRYVTSQFGVRRTDDRAVRYLFDIHLKISNAWAYADCLSYDEIRTDAVPMPRLDARALAPSPVHSLFIACVHRIAHHADSEDILWLYDISLLARRLTPSEWNRALTLAEEKQLCGVVLRGIERAARVIGEAAPEDVMQRLSDRAGRERQAPLMDANGARARMIDIALTDLRALPDMRARLQLVAEHLLPPTWYMRRAYPRWPAPLLPLAYAYRIARGAPRWFRRK